MCAGFIHPSAPSKSIPKVFRKYSANIPKAFAEKYSAKVFGQKYPKRFVPAQTLVFC
jgi:hypothetical protein